ncbi:Uncharacterized protein ChrSV_3451 [Chromobacterium vaccinii]|nr:Uncharacterized protein ChrSW_3451 [Chromobacterium vaccinii]QND90908.1 Uncharacterized protein ChrSV_3451 [Chromobacterium vaccinii]
MLDMVNEFKPALMPQPQFVGHARPSTDSLSTPDIEVESGIPSNDAVDTLPLTHTFHAANRMRDALLSVQDALDLGRLPDADVLDDKDLAAHQLKTNLSALSASRVKVPAHVRPLLSSLPMMLPLAKEEARNFEAGRQASLFSDVELWGKVRDGIDSLNKNYLQQYQKIVSTYTEFYKKFSDEVLAKIGEWVKSVEGKDGKADKIELNIGAMKAALNKVKDADNEKGGGWVLYDGEGAGKWFKELTGKDGGASNGLKLEGGKVMVDVSVLDKMVENLDKLNTPSKLDSAAFQAWKSGFDSQAEQLKNTLQVLTQKYSNANSTFDNMVKVLSSTITACLETDKLFLQI